MKAPSNMPVAAAGLVRRYYVYAGVYTLAASLIWGINTLFLLDAGLSISGVFLANAAFSVGTVLFEIPTGVVADTIGRRASFLLSLVVLAASTLAYVGLARVGGGIVAFSAVSVVMGLGYTFYSGAMEAWLVDGVRELGFAGPLDRVFSVGQIVGGVAMLIGTVGGGFLGQIDLALPFLLRSLLLVVLFFLAAFGMHDIGFQARKVTLRTLPAEATAIGKAGIAYGWRARPLRLIMVAGAIQSGFFFWAWYAWQPYFLDLLDRDAVWVVGVVAAVLSLATIAGNALVRVAPRIWHRRTSVLIAGGTVFALASIGIGLAGTFPLALSFLIVASIAMGMQAPVRQTLIHGMVPSAQRATVVSFDSLVSGVGSVAGQAGLGIYADRRSYAGAYVLGGAVALLSIPFVWGARRLRPPADLFGTDTVTDSGSCVPAGLPAISGVEGAPDEG